MKNQLIHFLLLLFIFSACGDNSSSSSSAEMAEAATIDSQPTTKVEKVEKEPVKQKGDVENNILEIRKEFGRIEDLIKNKQVVKKEVEYSCPDDPQGGNFIFYFSEDNLIKATHSLFMGDHYGQESSYYFKDRELIFGFHQSSVWNFAGTDDDGNTMTKDDINVQRDYFYKGEIVKQLFKDYSLISGKDVKKENEVPNQTTGKGVDNILAGEKILSISIQDVINCEMLL